MNQKEATRQVKEIMWVQILPKGKEIQGKDGRTFINEGSDKLASQFNQEKREIPIDIAHAGEVSDLGKEPPAIGWICKMEAREEELWAQIQWRKEGLALLQDKQYKYISPALVVKDGKIKEISSIGITNHPNLIMKSLNSKSKDKQDVLFLAKAMELQFETKEKQNDLEIALQRARKAETELEAFKAKEETKVIENMVEDAIEKGKILPISKAIYMNLCKTKEGRIEFEETIKKMPSLYLEQEILIKQEESDVDFNKQEKDMLATLQISTKQIKELGK